MTEFEKMPPKSFWSEIYIKDQDKTKFKKFVLKKYNTMCRQDSHGALNEEKK